MRNIYAIRDRLAGSVTTLHLHAADVAAIRFFGDVASHEGTLVNKHPKDFELIRLGSVDDNGRVSVPCEVVKTDDGYSVRFDEPVVVLTGELWVAAQQGA